IQMAAQRSRQLNGSKPLSLSERSWQTLSSSDEVDPGVTGDLAAALVDRPHDAELHNALGLVTALAEKGPGPVTSTLAQKVVGYFQRAAENDPNHLMAGLNLAEALVGLNQKDAAVAQAKRILATI